MSSDPGAPPGRRAGGPGAGLPAGHAWPAQAGPAGPAFEAREFPLTEHDFERIRRLIYAQAGISLCPMKREMVYNRLSRRLRTLGLKGFGEYLERIEGGDAAETQAFINALTTNLTAFFREAHHFDLLAEHLRRIPPDRSITIWSCASSTGEEPYSIAMTVVEALGGFDARARILATDIDTTVLDKAQAGVYELESLAKLDRRRLQQFFLRGTGRNEGLARVCEGLRQMVTFRQLNLRDASWPLRGPFDAIFCRNVMIYFDKPTQYGILERFAPLLHPEGLLVAGHSESFLHASKLFAPCGRTVYRKVQR